MQSKARVMGGAVACVAALWLGGCTTKNYVRQQTTPLMDHVNQLDAETAKNTNAIRDTDQRTQQGLADVNQSSQQAQTQAQAAQWAAGRVNTQLASTGNQITALDASVANLDNYTEKSGATVHFAFDKAVLTPESISTLDPVIATVQQDSHAIIEVQGYTDSTGSVAYNEDLSQRRAGAVVRYLETHGVAPHRIFLIGLGEDQAVAANTTAAGRQQNRRVDLKVLDDGVAPASNNSAGPGAGPGN